MRKIHKGYSLSKSADKPSNFISSKNANNKDEGTVVPIVSGLAGIIKNHDELNMRDSYTDYLIKKYK